MVVPAVLVAAGLILAAILFGQGNDSVNAGALRITAAKPSRPAALPQQVDSGKAFALPPLSTFDAILKRPIFSPNRRAAQGSTVVVSQELGMILRGITSSADQKFIILVPQDGGDAVRLREGEDYRGWTLTQVDPALYRVVFKRDDKEEQLELIFDERPPQVRPRQRQRNRRTAVQPSQQQGQQQGLRRTTRQDQNQSQNQIRTRNQSPDAKSGQSP
jgi:hypothetical protein